MGRTGAAACLALRQAVRSASAMSQPTARRQDQAISIISRSWVRRVEVIGKCSVNHNTVPVMICAVNPNRNMVSVFERESLMANVTPAACRAARAIMEIGVRQLGERTGVGFASISAFENGRSMRESNKAKLLAVFEAEGVEILNGDSPGARLRRNPTEQ